MASPVESYQVIKVLTESGLIQREDEEFCRYIELEYARLISLTNQVEKPFSFDNLGYDTMPINSS